MPGEVPTDVPPAAFGRFRVLHRIGAGSLGPVFRGEDPDTREPVAIKQLRLNLPPQRAREVSEALLALVGRVADHPCLARVLDAGLYEVDPYVVTTFSSGESLDVALREYGPAAIVDALPRLRGLAEALDQAAAVGIWHGSLQPRDIVVSAAQTQLSGLGIAPLLERAGVGRPAPRPYTAPEVLEGQPSSPASDQYALAAIAHEWLFGKRAAGAADSGLRLPSLPDVDSEALARALTAGLAPDPANRFPSSTALVAAMEAALSRASRDHMLARDTPLDSARDTPPAMGEPAGVAALMRDDDTVEQAPPDLVIADLFLDPQPQPPRIERRSQTPAPAAPHSERAPGRTPLGLLALALLAGLAIGGIGGYLLGTARAVQTAPAGRGFTDAPVAADPAAAVRDDPPVVAGAPPAPVARDVVPVPSARLDAAPAARVQTARLLVRSTPAGATVMVDGTLRGVTPLALRELELGTRTIVVSRPGYMPVERSITLTADRPSRSMEVALAAGARPEPGRAGRSEPSAGTGPERSRVTTTGSLVIDSRPTGAAVTIDGQPAGKTPLTLTTLSPGAHSVRIERVGYRPWTTTIDVKAGERSRVAASLVGGQGQE